MRLEPARIPPISLPFPYLCSRIASIKSPYDLDSMAPEDHMAKPQTAQNDSSLNFEGSVALGVQVAVDFTIANGQKDLHLYWPLLR